MNNMSYTDLEDKVSATYGKMTAREMSEKFGVSRQQIYRIITKLRRNHDIRVISRAPLINTRWNKTVQKAFKCEMVVWDELEDILLGEEYLVKPVWWLVKRFNRPFNEIEEYAERLMKKSPRLFMQHHIDFDPFNDEYDNIYMFRSIESHAEFHLNLYKVIKGAILSKENCVVFKDGRLVLEPAVVKKSLMQYEIDTYGLGGKHIDGDGLI